jgi:hypothetical protein
VQLCKYWRSLTRTHQFTNATTANVFIGQFTRVASTFISTAAAITTTISAHLLTNDAACTFADDCSTPTTHTFANATFYITQYEHSIACYALISISIGQFAHDATHAVATAIPSATICAPASAHSFASKHYLSIDKLASSK